MRTFQYTALTRDGQETAGRLDAVDSREAAATLRAQQLIVVRIEDSVSRGELDERSLVQEVGSRSMPLQAVRRRGLRYTLAKLRPVLARDKVLFFRQLALMLRAGITIVQALRVNARQSSSPRLERISLELAANVQAGKSFSAALAEHPKHFSNMHVKLVESAEASGELDVILDQVAQRIENQAELKTQLLTSLSYPLIVVILSVFVAVFLVLNVIPKFASFFLRRGLELPWLTQFLVDISDVIRQYGLIILGVISALCILVGVLYSTPRGRFVFDVVLLKLPVTGNLIVSSAIAQLSRNLSMLIRSGVTLFEALRVTAGTMNNRALAVLLGDSADSILKGQPLAETMDRAILPAVVPQLIAVGEHTGSLEEVLGELGDFYEQDLDARVRRTAALAGPVVILTVGGLVAFVYFAFFLALVKMISKGF